jgi:hypothetical protein
MLVTPGQRVLWAPNGARDEPRMDLAERLVWRGRTVSRARSAGFLLATSTYDAPTFPGKVFPGVRRSTRGPKPRDVAMTGDHYAAFMGMYVAEGNVAVTPNDWLVRISQMEYTKGFAEYRDLLGSIFGKVPGRGGHQWSIHSRALYEYFQPFGKARTKYVPQEVLDLSRRQLEIFWHYYFLGDGNYEDHKGRSLDGALVSTASPLLAGQLQEILQKLGYSGSVRRYLSKANHLVRSSNWIHKLRIRRTTHPAFAVTEVPYAGMVGSVQVPSGVIYVRKDGHPAWSGSA